MSNGKKSTTPGAWGAEATGDDLPNARRETDTGHTGEQLRNQQIGVSRTIDEGVNSAQSPVFLELLGGILDLLIEDALSHQEKMQECVRWYQQEVEQAKQKVEKLKQYQQTERHSSSTIDSE